MANVSYFADDVGAAQDWYRDVLGIDAYFRQPPEGPPAYVEFRVGDSLDELGIVDRRYQPAGAGDGRAGPGGAIVYWHVDDPVQALADLLARGATLHDPVRERGEGFVTASVVDPFGNVLGVMYNPHYVEVLAKG
jgi:predicted enzyme related to lactoylglutathione lyase